MNMHSARNRQQGLSLVELLVGVAIGLIVVAAAALAVASQLGENRRLLVETQLQQDLRASSDIITRELRRTGAQLDGKVLQSVWRPGKSNTFANVYAAALPRDYSTASTVPYRYQPTTGSDGILGFKLDGDAIKQLRAEGGGWQELTDPNVMKVTAFSIEPRNSTGALLPCPKVCTNDPANNHFCPRIVVRELLIKISAEAKNFSGVQRTMVSHVRLRNDDVQFWDVASNQVCPP
jgi:type IV pilus assembly protein PilW